jgi:hypothetical protein
MNPEIIQKFSDQFLSKEKELIVLIESTTNGATYYNGAWVPSNNPLAYIDVETGELCEENIRLEWLVADESNWQYYFAPLEAFRIKVRLKKPELSHPEQHCFMLVAVLEENVIEPRFDPIFEEDNPEITYEDEDFSLDLDREQDWFEGDILYTDKQIIFGVETTELSTLQNLLKSFKNLTKDNFNLWIEHLKTFAAEKLTDLANKWLKETGVTTPMITQKSFAYRINITSIILFDDERFCIYFDDDDMFCGHAITVYGNLNGELEEATIEG